ncbi:MAG: hypothetical protein R3F25_03905 [Gammaproteobacteria bacterium]|jgi:hypothetical protein|nr:hypothetical protein [Xanthomonadales bacterium]
MFIKEAILLLLVCSVSMAQTDGFYRTDNFTAWKVVKANKKEQYLELVSVDDLEPRFFSPICMKDNRMIFKYELLGHDDSFYDKDAKVKDIDFLNRSIYSNVVFALKIDIEEGNDFNGNPEEEYNRICKENNSQRFTTEYRSKRGMAYHGVIKYVGDSSIQPQY